jgi:hypothetical protein
MFGGSSERRSEFLRYLMGTSGWAQKRRQHMLAQAEHYRAYGVSGPVLQWTTEVASAEEYAAAEQALTNTLRSYVDEWLDSGKTPDGQGGYNEEPSKRALSIDAQQAVNEYLREHSPQFFVFEGNKIGAVFAEEQTRQTGPDDPMTAAKKEADRLLVHFMDSDARWRLMRCYVCRSRYFFPERMKDVYLRGAYCEHCRPTASTLNNRKGWTERMLGLAAAAWPKWKPSHGPRERWVAMQVNGKLKPGEKRISGSGRWVTEKRAEIKKRVQEMQDATAKR